MLLSPILKLSADCSLSLSIWLVGLLSWLMGDSKLRVSRGLLTFFLGGVEKLFRNLEGEVSLAVVTF